MYKFALMKHLAHDQDEFFIAARAFRWSQSSIFKAWRCPVNQLSMRRNYALMEGTHQPSLSPTKLMTRTFSLTSIGSGQRIPADISLFRLRISFSAQSRTILRGFRRLYPRRNRYSPVTYLSRSLKTSIDVL